MQIVVGLQNTKHKTTFVLFLNAVNQRLSIYWLLPIRDLKGFALFLVPVLLVMEFCTGGNLQELLRDSRINEEYKNIYSKLTERQLINFAAEIAQGMKFLFQEKVNYCPP